MAKRQARRIVRPLTSAETQRLAKYREQVAGELPDMTTCDQMRKDARDEATLSGELRRTIHQSDLSLAEIAVSAGLSPTVLDDFLTGERTLRSDAIDRLTMVLGYELNPSR